MGKFFAILLVVITLVSVYPIIAHTWWPPPVVSAHGPEVDHQLDETMIGFGDSVCSLSICSRWVYLGIRKLQRENQELARRTQTGSGVRHHSGRPGDSQPLVRRIEGVGFNVYCEARSTRTSRRRAGRAVRFLFPVRRTGRRVWLDSSGQNQRRKWKLFWSRSRKRRGLT